MLTILIDNFDSFTWNIYEYLCLLGTTVKVFRNNAVDVAQIEALSPDNIVISPGPSHPRDAGISNDMIRHFSGKIPILGVCLGHQCMYEIFGGTVNSAGEMIHGKTSKIYHDSKGVFQGIPQGVAMTRYHSLAGDRATLPDSLEVTAWTENGIIMGIRHKEYIVEGVQFHPESIISEHGKQLLANFLSWSGSHWSNLKMRPLLNDKMDSTSILEKICAQRKKDVQLSMELPGKSRENLEALIAHGFVPQSLVQRLEGDLFHVFAEIKRASPSKGDIAPANAWTLATEYALGGASVISVLTEPNWFKGSLEDLRQARLAVDTMSNRPLILRKDFVLDEYQLLEARLYGADSCLLIVATLKTRERLSKLLAYSRLLGMEPLVEIVNEEELSIALEAGSLVIGVNNRDLHSFTVDSLRTVQLADKMKNVLFIALSGITSSQDARLYQQCGARGVLVGEALMKTTDRRGFIQGLLGSASTVSEPLPLLPRTLIKICGITNVQDALTVKELNVDLMGIIFAPSPRQVSIEVAQSIAKAIGSNSKQSEIAFSNALSNCHYYSSKDWYQYWNHYLLQQRHALNRPLLVGVFMDASLYFILETIRSVRLDVVQLHGNEDLNLCKLIPLPVIKVFHVTPEIKDLKKQVTDAVGNAHIPLLDTASQAQKGGTGKTFDWQQVFHLDMKVMIAGGLNAENIDQLLSMGSVLGVDASSGLESSPGIKEKSKLYEFVQKIN